MVEWIRKLQALAKRGVGGEKDTTEKMLQKMLLNTQEYEG